VGQYDIHRNPGRKTARTHPFLMVVQSDRWAGLDTRLVAPLVLRSTVPADEIAQSYLTPIFTIDGREVFLNPFDLTPVPVERLGPVVASFAQDEDARRRIQKALDEALNPYRTRLVVEFRRDS
jgi:toxin CcdB